MVITLGLLIVLLEVSRICSLLGIADLIQNKVNGIPEFIIMILPNLMGLVMNKAPRSNAFDIGLIFTWTCLIVLTCVYTHKYNQSLKQNNKSSWREILKSVKSKRMLKILLGLYLVSSLFGIGSFISNQAYFKTYIMKQDTGSFMVKNKYYDNDSEDEQPSGKKLRYVQINKRIVKGYSKHHNLIMIYHIRRISYSERHHGLLVYGKYTTAKDGVSTKGEDLEAHNPYQFRLFKANMLLGYKKHHAYISTQGSNNDRYLDYAMSNNHMRSALTTPFGGSSHHESEYDYRLVRK